MKKISILLSSALLAANMSYAQSTSSDIRESTDASKISEIEQHAQQLSSQQSSSGASTSSDKSSTGSSMKKKHAKHKKGAAQQKSDGADTSSK